MQRQTQAWCERLAKIQGGYFYPWQCEIPPHNGEDSYLDLVKEHVDPGKDLLEAGCGHGVDALILAPLCKHFIAYDMVQDFIDTATASAQEAGIANATFICANSSSKQPGGAKVPLPDDSVDLIVSRRGPTSWIFDARRVARPGAVLIQLNPMRTSIPTWNDELPEVFRFDTPDPGHMRRTIEERLAQGGLSLHSAWTFDMPAYFPDAEQLYIMLTFGCVEGEMPPYDEVRPALEAIFDRHATDKGLDLRADRFLWKAIVE